MTNSRQPSSKALRDEQGSAPENELRIGPAGWAYKDWSGYVYPVPRQKGFHEATFLAQFFDTIEINTSFYRPLRAEQAEQWVERVAANPRFMFTAKLWQRFTHDPSPSAQDEREVRAGFDTLHHAGKLGAVLAQFPFAFHRSPETVSYLGALLKRFTTYPLVVEFRHSTWNVPETFAMLRAHNVGFCNIDQPLIGRALEASAEVTSPIGYVRLHGRRYDTWFTNDETVPSYERYNYLYNESELRPWAGRIRTINAAAKQTYVVTNNHYLGKGVVNALQLISILKHAKIKIPEPLREPYPALNEIAIDPPSTPTLFPVSKTRT
jgi:uncharacterized protein YecE (DUF72 family)